jgi:K+ transporter
VIQVAVIVALLVGVRMLATTSTDVHAGPGWVPLALAGVAVLVFTFRSHSRLD